ncbi:MAG: hypothetical protein K1X67_11010 [Fimbriimonadaceae bacterium]|nr:hypothetical protein [Fimbriimonadaceae bacterium]
MNFKVLILAALAAMFVVGLSGCSGETGTNEVKELGKEMKSDKSDAIGDAIPKDVDASTTMGPPGGKTSQRMGGGK